MLLKKSKKIILIVISISVLLLTFIGGQTYAKYMSRVTGQGTADIANWSFKVNENEEKIQTISLKSNVNNSTLSNNKIAPGTEGKFQIKIDATDSDVGISYFIKFENESKKPTNLKFIYDEKIYNSLSEVQQDLAGIINADEQDKTKILNIAWKWAYETGTDKQSIENNDLIDTKEAKQINNYTFDVIISGTQVMPQN